MASGFHLIETMLFDADLGEFPFLERHLNRLLHSSQHFGFICPVDEIRAELKRQSTELSREAKYRARLLLGEQGRIEIAVSKIEAPGAGSHEPKRVLVSEFATDPSDPFLYHKTTRRELYDEEFQRWSEKLGVFDVVFLNTRGELTEGSRTNLFIEKNGVLRTPPVGCGLLNGVMRQTILASGGVSEERMGLEDLRGADRLWVANSVRGLIEVGLIDGRGH